MACCGAPSSSLATCLPTLSTSPRKQLIADARPSFLGLRSATKLHRLGLRAESSFASRTSAAKSAARTVCGLNSALIISLSNGALLFLGRFVFLPFQREQVAKAGLPQQNGETHFEAGDTRAVEVTSLLKTNDPAGFTIVDVLAWGALGHAVGFFILATATNGYDPTF